jgi:hypothetical protein
MVGAETAVRVVAVVGERRAGSVDVAHAGVRLMAAPRDVSAMLLPDSGCVLCGFLDSTYGHVALHLADGTAIVIRDGQTGAERVVPTSTIPDEPAAPVTLPRTARAFRGASFRPKETP